MENRSYLCIDLKSFYASVECVERCLDALTTNLVVADPERGDKTICLAVSPSLKALGVKNRCRVFEIPKQIPYIMAPPRMKLYIEYSANIYAIYLRYVAKEDIHVYSIDEAFLDVTDYLGMYGMTARQLAVTIMEDVKRETGITATAGIGTNLYLAKVALDITAKHVPDHIGCLDEESYCRTLWGHRPMTDFWRIGRGTVSRLERAGIRTMGEVAHADEDLLYRMFGVDAELLIDHAWGRENTTMADIKAYKPKENAVSSGQVLPRDYRFDEARLVTKEMADALCLDLTGKGLATDSVTLHVGYSYRLERKSAHGTGRLPSATSSARRIIACTDHLFEKIVDRNAPVRRISVTFNHVMDELYRQYDLFTSPEEAEKEQRLQKAVIISAPIAQPSAASVKSRAGHHDKICCSLCQELHPVFSPLLFGRFQNSPKAGYQFFPSADPVKRHVSRSLDPGTEDLLSGNKRLLHQLPCGNLLPMRSIDEKPSGELILREVKKCISYSLFRPSPFLSGQPASAFHPFPALLFFPKPQRLTLFL